MDSQFGAFGAFGPRYGPRRTSSYDPSIRVSDAERTQMSDTLSKHYADGRLDDAEFKVRLDRAMAAKTRGDLSGLLSDLPPLHPEVQRRRPGGVRRAWWAFMVLATVFLAVWAVSAVTAPHISWILIIVVLAFVWHRWPGRYSHHHSHRDEQPASF